MKLKLSRDELTQARSSLRQATSAADKASVVEAQLREEAAGLAAENQRLRKGKRGGKGGKGATSAPAPKSAPKPAAKPAVKPAPKPKPGAGFGDYGAWQREVPRAARARILTVHPCTHMNR